MLLREFAPFFVVILEGLFVLVIIGVELRLGIGSGSRLEFGSEDGNGIQAK